jgi:nicotinamidase-related amidase
MAPNTSSGAALIVVDVQYDFMPPQGSLNVPGGDDVVPVISDLLDNRSYQWDVVVASQVSTEHIT